MSDKGAKTREDLRGNLRIPVSLLALAFPLFFSACACKEKERIIFKEVRIPVQKRLELPSKPHYDGSAQSAKARMEYYEAIEKLCGAKE